MKKINKKLSFIQILAFSYACFFLFPVLVNLFIYYQIDYILEDELTYLSDNQCDMLASEFNSQINVVESVMGKIATNSTISSYMNEISSGETGDSYAAFLLSRELNTSILNTNVLSGAFLYFTEQDVVISEFGIMNKAVAYDVYAPQDGSVDFAQWDKFLCDTHQREMYPSNNLIDNDETFAYLQSLPFGNPSATLVILIDKDIFFTIVNQSSNQNQLVYIRNLENVTISANTEEAFPNDIVTLNDEQNSAFSYQLNDSEYYVVSVRSDELKTLNYVFLIPRESFLNKIDKIRVITFVTYFVVFILGVFGVIYFSRKNAEPVNKIIGRIAKNLAIDPKQCFTQYEQFLDSFWNELNASHSKSKKQFETLRYYFVYGLLLGASDNEMQIAKEAKEYGVYYEDYEYVVILVNVYEYQNFFGDIADGIDTEEQRGLVQFALMNVFNDMFKDEYHCTAVPLKEFDCAVALIICIEESSEYNEIISEAYTIVSNNLGIYFTAAVSGAHRRADLSEAYYEAVSVLDTSVAFQNDASNNVTIKLYRTETTDERSILTNEVENKLKNYMFLEETEEVKELISDILQRSTNMPIDCIINIKFRILNLLLQVLPERDWETFCEKYSPTLTLINTKTIEETKKAFDKIVDRLQECFAAQKNDQSRFLSGEIIEYITENYKDVGLSITMIADHFGMSPYYISKQFKKERGDSLKNYINVYRVERSKEILIHTNDTLNEIAARVGFIDNNAFIRGFKRCEGITPGEYRKKFRT